MRYDSFFCIMIGVAVGILLGIAWELGEIARQLAIIADHLTK